jgi:general secretion pathway protein K
LRKDRQGFVLIFAMMALATIGLVVSATLVGNRSRVRQTVNIKGAAEAEAIADGVAKLLTLALWRDARQGIRSQGHVTLDGSPVICRLSSSVSVELRAEDEGGKVDINAASPALIEWLLKLAATAPVQSVGALQDILVFRERQAAQNGGIGFLDTAELQDALPRQSPLVGDLLPFVTVYTRLPGVDGGAAPAALRSALSAKSGQFAIPPAFQRPSPSSVFRIVASVRFVDRAVFAREAVVDFNADDGQSYVFRRWSRIGNDSLRSFSTVHQNSGTEENCPAILRGFSSESWIAKAPN